MPSAKFIPNCVYLLMEDITAKKDWKSPNYLETQPLQIVAWMYSWASIWKRPKWYGRCPWKAARVNIVKKNPMKQTPKFFLFFFCIF